MLGLSPQQKCFATTPIDDLNSDRVISNKTTLSSCFQRREFFILGELVGSGSKGKATGSRSDNHCICLKKISIKIEIDYIKYVIVNINCINSM